MGGAVAASSATVIFHPMDTVKTLLQRGAGGTSGFGGGTAVVRSIGLGGVYRGVVPAAISMGSACAVRMAVYETIKMRLLDAGTALPASVLVGASSAASVVVSALVRAPLDLIKTIM